MRRCWSRGVTSSSYLLKYFLLPFSLLTPPSFASVLHYQPSFSSLNFCLNVSTFIKTTREHGEECSSGTVSKMPSKTVHLVTIFNVTHRSRFLHSFTTC